MDRSRFVRTAMSVSSILRQFALLSLICCSYLLIACWSLGRPGLEYDEVLFANGALGHLDSTFSEYSWGAPGIDIPLMLTPYIGAVKAWMYKPIFKLLPTTAITVRLPVVLLGMATLIATYLFVLRLLGKTVALVAVAVLATDPSYIFHIRLDWGPVAIMMFTKLASLYLFLLFARNRRVIFLASAAFLLGLGMYDKANFIWFMAALPVAAAATWPAALMDSCTTRNMKIVFAAFMMGSWPLWIYNIVRARATFQGRLSLAQNLPELLRGRADTFMSTINGSAAFEFVARGTWFRKPDPYHRLLSFGTLLLWIAPIVLIIALIIALVDARHNRAVRFLLVLSTLILAQTCLPYRQDVGSHHILMLYPFHLIIIAYSFTPFSRNALRGWGAAGGVGSPITNRFSSQGNGISKAQSGSNANNAELRELRSACLRSFVAAALLALLIASNVAIDMQYLRLFSHVGGRGIWSDAVFDLAKYAQDNDGITYVLMDWGFSPQLLVLSRGKINKREVFWELLDPSRESELTTYVYTQTMNPHNIFVFHTPSYTLFPQPRRVFERMLEEHGLREEVVKVFRQGDGNPVYILERGVTD